MRGKWSGFLFGNDIPCRQLTLHCNTKLSLSSNQARPQLRTLTLVGTVGDQRMEKSIHIRKMLLLQCAFSGITCSLPLECFNPKSHPQDVSFPKGSMSKMPCSVILLAAHAPPHPNSPIRPRPFLSSIHSSIKSTSEKSGGLFR